MDRQSFINKDFLNSTGTDNKCLLDDCECEIMLLKEKQELKKTSSVHFATIIMMAFAYAIVFSIVKTEAAKTNVTEFILVKKEKVISCIPGYTNKKKLNDNHKPAEENNQNNCSHQQGASSLCKTTNSKRRVFKIHTC